MARLITKKSTVAAKVPLAADLEIGELAVNTADAKLYTKHNDGNVVGIKAEPLAHTHAVADVTGLQAALDAASLPLVHTTTTQTAIPGQHYSLENAAATTLTLPASPIDGDVVWVTVSNGRTDNVLARNSQQIMGVAEDMTLDVVMTYQLRFIGTSWRLL